MGSKKIFVANVNITEVFWGYVNYVKGKKPFNDQLTNLDKAQQTRFLEIYTNEDVNIDNKDRQWQLAQMVIWVWRFWALH